LALAQEMAEASVVVTDGRSPIEGAEVKIDGCVEGGSQTFKTSSGLVIFQRRTDRPCGITVSYNGRTERAMLPEGDNGPVPFNLLTSPGSGSTDPQYNIGSLATTSGTTRLGLPIGGVSEIPKGDLAYFVNLVYNFAVAAGTSLAVIMIMFAGYKYITSSGNPEGIAEAKDILFGSITGLVIILLTYVILRTIDPNLLNPPTINP